VALIALQDRATQPANLESLRRLRTMVSEANSGLALCWGAICLKLYGQASADWQSRIERHFGETGFLGETKTLALALMALSGKATALRV
jgi:hypothetical protein